MVEFKRSLDLGKLLEKKSIFLLGPRQTGKSTLIYKTLREESTVIDLLKGKFFIPLSQNPSALSQMIDFKKKIVVIDEIQKLPALLDEVHSLIEERKIRFLLTGSSARKLKKGNANLLAGRAWNQYFHPLSFSEIKEKNNYFDLNRYLLYGGLPSVWGETDPVEELDAYVSLYLKEEIKEEGLVRNLGAFSRFLEVAALSSGELINYTKIASDCAVPMTTVRDYFSILEDTLLGVFLHPYRKTKSRKSVGASKFYFFDIGVSNYLCGIRSLSPKTPQFGKIFEQFIINEMKTFLDYRRIKEDLFFWQSNSKNEVDLIIGDKIALEIKSTNNLTERHLVGLKKIAEEKIFKSLLIISFDETFKSKGAIVNYHWEDFLTKLWNGEIL